MNLSIDALGLAEPHSGWNTVRMDSIVPAKKLVQFFKLEVEATNS